MSSFMWLANNPEEEEIYIHQRNEKSTSDICFDGVPVFKFSFNGAAVMAVMLIVAA